MPPLRSFPINCCVKIIDDPCSLKCGNNHATYDSLNSILILSRGTAMILIILYVLTCTFSPKHIPGYLRGARRAFHKVCSNSKSRRKLPHVYFLLQQQLQLSLQCQLLLPFGPNISLALLMTPSKASVNRTFIGLIILPFIGNATDYVSAIMSVFKHKMD